jgi:hypothetical protein
MGKKKTVGFLKSDSTHKTSSNSHLTYQSQSSLSGDNVLLFGFCTVAFCPWQMAIQVCMGKVSTGGCIQYQV